MDIDTYAFGRIVIDGTAYTSDVIIHSDRVDAAWWRKDGHNLCAADLDGVWDTAPDSVIVGTGAYGRMAVPEETRAYARSRGAELHAAPTAEAVALFRRLSAESGKKVVAALHLTC